MARSIGPKNDKQGAQPGRHARAVVRVNRRLVLVTLGVGAALLAATYVVHGFQMERHADTVLARADAAEKDGQIGQAIAFLAHYTQFRPDDTDSLLRLGRLRQQTADDYRQWAGVFFIFEEVLRRNPTHPEAAAIRRDIVDVAMKIGEFDEARVHLEALLATDSDNAELHHLLGLCWHAERKFDKAVRA
jgi:tetratricopeptide (TPR) repeat protein